MGLCGLRTACRVLRTRPVMQYIAAAPINRLRTGRPRAIIEGPNSKMILCVCLTAISVGAKAASIPGDGFL